MCKNPIKIKNNSKYITENTGHQYYIWVNCGKCSECRQSKIIEWNLRTYYQSLETITNGGWIYFDTLTYDRYHLPRLNKLIKDKDGNPINKSYACFNYQDIRDFYEKLRGWYGDRAFKYFITSEYGSIKNRSHYHIILFIQDNNIEPIQFSNDVYKAWSKGRTDGIPFKSNKYVLQHNVIRELNLNAIRYVAKYVTKSQHFLDIVNKRWHNIENYYTNTKNYDKLKIKALKRKYFYYCTPFHRQSQHYGETALYYMTENDLWNKGIIFYKDDSLKINQYTKLPMYFKRKLTQKQIKYNGKRIWINTEEGIKWKSLQEHRLYTQIKDRYNDLNTLKGKPYTTKEIEATTKYILYERGRLAGNQDYKPHHEEATLFNYNTDKDLKNLNHKCISRKYIGNDIQGYATTELEEINTIEDKIYINTELERIIENLKIDEDDKTKVILKEHLAEIKKTYFKAI